MYIRVSDVNYNKTLCIGKLGSEEVLGYWSKFLWNETVGYSFIFPYNGQKERLLLDVISVETDQKGIKNFELCKEKEACYLFSESDVAGNYYVSGKICNVYEDDNKNIELIYVQVNDALFALDKNDIQNNEVKEGDWVKFELLGLSLCDEGVY